MIWPVFGLACFGAVSGFATPGAPANLEAFLVSAAQAAEEAVGVGVVADVSEAAAAHRLVDFALLLRFFGFLFSRQCRLGPKTQRQRAEMIQGFCRGGGRLKQRNGMLVEEGKGRGVEDMEQ